MSSFKEALIKFCGFNNMTLNEDKVDKDLESVEVKKDSALEIKKSHDLVNQISVEVVAEPYTPDAHGHWYSQDTVLKGFESADKAWKEKRLHMNLFHAHDDTENTCIELLKHYVVPFDCEVNGQKVKEGTWVAEVKWHDQELWKKRTEVLDDGSTEIAGLSLKGWGVINDPVATGEQLG